MSFEYVLAAIDRDIAYRKMIIKSAAKHGCDGLPSISVHRSDIAELEQIRANLEAIQGRVVCLNLDGSIGRSGWSPCPSSISIKTTCGVVKARRAAKSRKRRVK